MRPAQTKKINSLLSEIKTISQDLPKGRANMVSNRCSKIQVIIKKNSK